MSTHGMHVTVVVCEQTEPKPWHSLLSSAPQASPCTAHKITHYEMRKPKLQGSKLPNTNTITYGTREFDRQVFGNQDA